MTCAAQLRRLHRWSREVRQVMSKLLAMERPYVSAASGYTMRRLLRLADDQFGPTPKRRVTKAAIPARRTSQGTQGLTATTPPRKHQ